MGRSLPARKVYPEVLPKVEDSLTELGRTFEPIVMALKAWGDAYAGLAPKACKGARRTEAARRDSAYV